MSLTARFSQLFFCFIATFLLISCGSGLENSVDTEPVQTNQATEKSVSQLVPIFRFARISNGAYFYTGSAAEADAIKLGNPDFRFEGIAFYGNASGGTTVFRFANLTNGGYFYTASLAERDYVLTDPFFSRRFRLDAATFQIANENDNSKVPVYRLANLVNGAYLYTTNAAEVDYAVNTLRIWRDEGIKYYVAASAGAPGATDPGQAGLSGINPNVSGKLYYEAPGHYVELDLATGVERILRPRGVGLGVSADGEDFLMTTRFSPYISFGSSAEELTLFDRDGVTKQRWFKGEGFSGPTLLSPDKKHILVEWSASSRGDEVGVSVPTLFNVSDGTVFKRFIDYDAYQWMPDGRILLARGDALYLADKTIGTPTLLKRFTNDYPRALRVSPDGTKIAMTLLANTVNSGSSSSDRHVWVMNVDGSNLRQLTTSNGNEDVGDFSPDSQSMIVTQGIAFTAIGPGYIFAGCPESYWIPLNTTAPANLTANNPAPAQQLYSRDEDGDVRSKLCHFSRPYWRNKSVQPQVIGSSSTGSGLNKGLMGSLWYRFAGDIFKTDLFTGATNLLLPKTQGANIHVSLDGTEITFYDRFGPADPSDNDIVYLNTSGAKIGGFTYPEDFSGQVKQSPDKTKFAVEWHSIDLGDEGGVSVVTVFTRQGQILARFFDVNSWEWLPDGRLAMISYDELIITNVAIPNVRSTVPTTVLKILPDYGSRLVSSRDGRKLAFVMQGSVFTMNIDGSGMKKLTSADRPVTLGDFSPDGRFLLVESADTPYAAWVVSVDAERVFLGPGSPSSVTRIRSVENGSVRNLYPSGSVSWR
jgi:Tol biopolymer transport system component